MNLLSSFFIIIGIIGTANWVIRRLTEVSKMDMFLVTTEDQHGCWGDEPIGCDSLNEARQRAKEQREISDPSHTVVIYRCDIVDEL